MVNAENFLVKLHARWRVKEVDAKGVMIRQTVGSTQRVGYADRASEVISSVDLVNYAKMSSFGIRRIPHDMVFCMMKPKVRDRKSKRQVPGV